MNEEQKEKLRGYFDELKEMESRLYDITCDVFGDPLTAGVLGSAWVELFRGLDEVEDMIK